MNLTAASPSHGSLYAEIPRRHTNRGRYADAPAANALPSALAELVDETAIALVLLTDPKDHAAFRQGTIDATQAITGDAEMSRDSNVWYRHSKDEIERYWDGITRDASGNAARTRVLGKMLGRPSHATADRYWLDAARDFQTTASAFGILTSPADNARAQQLAAGRMYQRLALWCSSQGLAIQPLNQMAERQDREEVLGLAPIFTSLLATWIGPNPVASAPSRQAPDFHFSNSPCASGLDGSGGRR